MQRTTKYVLCILSLVIAIGLWLKATVVQVPSGTWAPAGTMAEARSGAASVLLQDGTILVTGGEGTTGALASAEFFSAGSFAAAPAMNVARSGHAAVVLKDGRVLVTGGKTTGGGVTNAAEVYSPALNSWVVIASMADARSGHTATLLKGGRVLLAGGEGSAGAVSTLEVFDPVEGTFTFAGTMSAARKDHAAARIGDQQVLIAGGSDSANTLASTEIYDPEAGAVTAGPVLSTPRIGLSATTLMDGSVLIAGGNNGTADLSTAERYNPETGILSVLGSSMAAARGNHSAFLLPNNNHVLIIGGTSGGVAVSTAELFRPWDGLFHPTGAMSSVHPGFTGSPLGLDGLLLVAGGNGLASSELYGFATLKTDKDDYAPGELVTMTGSGWQPGETVTLFLHEINNPDPHDDLTLTAVADASGRILNNQFAPDEHDIGIRFYLTASGANCQAQTTFTDAPKVGSVTVGSQTGTLTQGTAGSATYTITVARGSGGGSSGAFDAALSLTTSLPSGAAASFSRGSLAACTSGGQKTCFDSSSNTIRFASGDVSLAASLTITTTSATSAGTTSFAVKAETSASDFATGTGSLVVAPSTVAITVTTSPSGKQITVDGTTYTAPQTFNFAAGSNHTLDTPSPQSGGAGTQFVWTSWSQGGAKSQTITVPSSATTYTANFKTQFQITFAQSGMGGDSTGTIVTVNSSPKTTLPFSDFFDSGSAVTYTYSDPVTTSVAGKRYALTTPAPSPASGFTVSSALTITGTYKTQYQITFAQSGIGGDTTGTVVTVGGSAKTAAVLPFNDWFDAGSSLAYSYSDPVASTVSGKRYVLTTPAATPSSPITVAGSITVTGTYKIQYQITFAQSGIGADSTGTVVTVAGAAKTAGDLPFTTDWLDSGSSLAYSYSDPVASTVSGKRYVLTTPAATPPSPITVSGSITVTGTYKAQYKVTFDASLNVKTDGTGTIVTVGGNAKTAANLPFTTDFVDDGSSLTYSYASPVAVTATKQYRWESTSGLSQAAQSNTFNVTAAGTVTGTYKAQYKVTFDASANVKADGTGTIVTVAGNAKAAVNLPFTTDFVDDGSSLLYGYASSVAVSASKQYRWESTSGLTQTLQTNTFTVTVDGTVTGTYKAQYLISFDASANVKGDSTATIVTVDGSGHAFGALPFTKFVDDGGSVMYGYASPVGSTAEPGTKQYRWDTTSGLGQTLQTNTFTVAGAAGTVTGNYAAQYKITFTQTGIGGDSTGTIVTVAGSPQSTLPYFAYFDVTSTVSYTYSSPVSTSVTGKHYILTGTPPSPNSGFTVSAAITITATYKAQYDTSTMVASSLNPSVYGQSVMFTATVSTIASGSPTPAGSVQFIVDGGNFGPPVTLNSSGIAVSGGISNLTVAGSAHSVSAAYTSTVDSFTNSNGALSGGQTVTPAPLTITASSGMMTYGGSPYVVVPIPSGFVLGEGLGNLPTLPVCGPVFTTTTPAGPYTSSCSGPALDGNYTLTYVTGSVMVNQASTSTTVASSPNPSNWMDVVTVTATVSNTGLGGSTVAPTGPVAFYNAASGATCASLLTSTLLNTVPLATTGSGQQASTSTASLPVGTDTILACYNANNADPNYNANFVTSSVTTTQTVIPAPIASLTPPDMSFGNQLAGTTSNAQAVTLSNANGTATLHLSIGFTGTTPTWFTQTNTCGSSIAAGASCTINVKFSPPLNSTGVGSAFLTVTDDSGNVPGSTQMTSLTGAGLTSISDQSLYTNAIFATATSCGSITLSGGSTVDSFNSALGYSASHQNSGGNVGTNGNVTLSGGKSAIYGIVSSPISSTGNCNKTSTTGLSTSGGAQTGGLQQLSGPLTYPAPPLPSPAPPTTTQNISGSCPSGLAGCTNTGTKTVTLAPGQYGNLTLSGGTTAHVSMGTYNINSLKLSGNSILHVDSGPVVINLAGAGLSGGNPAMDTSGGSLENTSYIPSNLQFTYAGSRGVTLSGGSNAYATVYAPNALVNFSGGSDFYGSVIGSTITNSGGTSVHYDSNLPVIRSGNTIWFNAEVKNVNLNNLTSQVKLYMSNSSISFAPISGVCPTGTTGDDFPPTVCTLAVPNAVIIFNSASVTSGATTSYDSTNNRWVTNVAKSALASGNNTFVGGVAYPVPIELPSGIQNVSWSAAFSSDAPANPGISFQWHWGAAVYTQFGAYSSLGVNPEDGSYNAHPPDPAGTPESFKQYITFGGTGGGLSSYTGYPSTNSGIVPTLAPMSVSPSSEDAGPVAVGDSATTGPYVLTNNSAVSRSISSISIVGTNQADFTILTNTCPVGGALGVGGNCSITVKFAPTGSSGTKSAKIVINDDAPNSPQTVYLTGTVP